MFSLEAQRYGRNDSMGAIRCGLPVTRSCDIDVQYPLSRTCGGRRRCSLAVNTAFFGDPCGYDEFLTVTYRCVPDTGVHRRCSDSGVPVNVAWSGTIPGGGVRGAHGGGTDGIDDRGTYVDRGFLASPNYPGKYYMDAECQWTLRVQKQQGLRITLFDFELDVKRGGRCHDFLAVRTSRNVTVFSDCGALGKQMIEVRDNTAVISFRTGQTSLTQRGFILHFEAVGPGCSIDQSHDDVITHVIFSLDESGVLHRTSSCVRGYRFPVTDLDQEDELDSVRNDVCSGTTWSDVIPPCQAILVVPQELPSSTLFGDVRRFSTLSTVPSHLPLPPPSSSSISFVEHSAASVVGVAVGALSVLVLLVVSLLLVVYCGRRSSSQRQKEQWRMVVNNLQQQENVSNDVTKCIQDGGDKTYLEPMITSSVPSSKHYNTTGSPFPRRAAEDAWLNRNLLEQPRSPHTTWRDQDSVSGSGAVYSQIQHSWVVTDNKGGNWALVAPAGGTESGTGGGEGGGVPSSQQCQPLCYRHRCSSGNEHNEHAPPPDLITCPGSSNPWEEHRGGRGGGVTLRYSPASSCTWWEGDNLCDMNSCDGAGGNVGGGGGVKVGGGQRVEHISASPCCSGAQIDLRHLSYRRGHGSNCARLNCGGLNRSAPSSLDSPPRQDSFIL